ncbi:hypothetical protein ACOMHN_022442 [Nucella lapillus]
MGFCNCSPVVSTAIGLMQIGFMLVFTIVGLALPNWFNGSINGVDVNFGLWKYCSGDTCIDLPDIIENSKVEAARAFGIMGVLACVVVVGLAVLFLVKRNGNFLMIAGIVAFAGFVMVLIMFVVTVVNIQDQFSNTKWGFCFGLTLTGFIQGFFSGISFLGAGYRQKNCIQC